MGKTAYIKQEIERKLYETTTFVLGTGACFLVGLCALDYFVAPEFFWRFLMYRLAAAFSYTILLVLNRLRTSRLYQTILLMAAIASASTMVELMIFSLGGHRSTYYVGMIVIYLYSLGFLPLFSILASSIAALLTYAIYLIPILLFDHITDIRVFMNNNIFLLAIALSGLILRYFHDKILLNNFSLQYETARDKETIKSYADNLQTMVETRTQELLASEMRFRDLFENAPEGIAILDEQGVILTANKQFAELHGFSVDTMKGTSIKLLEKDSMTAIQRIRKIFNGETLTFETEHHRKDGSFVDLELTAKTVQYKGQLCIQAFYKDITEKKRLQKQLAYSQKMESIAVLASGVAHDFNNILTAIFGNVELIKEGDSTPAFIVKLADRIETAARRAQSIISKLLNFARGNAEAKLPCNLNDAVVDVLTLMQANLINRHVTVSLDMHTLPTLIADSIHLEQILMNLLVNASDAMPHGGPIKISTLHTIVDKEEARTIHPLLKEGQYVVLKVTDSGHGVPENVRDKIFDPFFSTKEKGKGSGLGLAIIYGIVKDYNGHVTMETREGEGTTFAIYFPVRPVSNRTRKNHTL